MVPSMQSTILPFLLFCGLSQRDGSSALSVLFPPTRDPFCRNPPLLRDLFFPPFSSFTVQRTCFFSQGSPLSLKTFEVAVHPSPVGSLQSTFFPSLRSCCCPDSRRPRISSPPLQARSSKFFKKPLDQTAKPRVHCSRSPIPFPSSCRLSAIVLEVEKEVATFPSLPLRLPDRQVESLPRTPRRHIMRTTLLSLIPPLYILPRGISQ